MAYFCVVGFFVGRINNILCKACNLSNTERRVFVGMACLKKAKAIEWRGVVEFRFEQCSGGKLTILPA